MRLHAYELLSAAKRKRVYRPVIQVGSGADPVPPPLQTEPIVFTNSAMHDANAKKPGKTFLCFLTLAAFLETVTVVTSTYLINETLKDLTTTTGPTTRPMIGTSRPGKWSSMPTETEAVHEPVPVRVRRLEGHSEETREVFKSIFGKVFKEYSTQVVLRIEIVVMVLAMMGLCGTLAYMQANAQAQGAGGFRRRPPAWSAENAHNYSFQTWMQDLLAWTLVCTDLDEPQQAGAIVLELSGEARNLVRNLSMQELQNGGLVNNQPVGPVSYLLSHLAMRFAPLGEETRMNAVTELMQFHRDAN